MASGRNKLMPERIIRSEILPMEDDDYGWFRWKRDRMLLYIASPYITISAIFTYQIISFIINYKSALHFWKFNNGDLVIIIMYSFCELMLTGFFIKYFLDSLYPIIKDMKAKKKTVLYYQVHKSDMGYLGHYFISTPIYATQQLEVSQDIFDQLQEGQLLTIETGVYADFILHLKNGKTKIPVNT